MKSDDDSVDAIKNYIKYINIKDYENLKFYDLKKKNLIKIIYGYFAPKI